MFVKIKNWFHKNYSLNTEEELLEFIDVFSELGYCHKDIKNCTNCTICRRVECANNECLKDTVFTADITEILKKQVLRLYSPNQKNENIA